MHVLTTRGRHHHRRPGNNKQQPAQEVGLAKKLIKEATTIADVVKASIELDGTIATALHHGLLVGAPGARPMRVIPSTPTSADGVPPRTQGIATTWTNKLTT